MKVTVNENKVDFLLDNNKPVSFGQGKDQQFSVKGCDSKGCSTLWKWFCRDVIKSHVEINVGGRDVLVEKKDAIRVIARSKLAYSSDPATLNKALSGERIKMMLENLDKFVIGPPVAREVQPEVVPLEQPKAMKPLAEKQPIAAMKLAEWKAKLQGINAPLDEAFFRKNGFTTDANGMMSIPTAKLTQILINDKGLVHGAADQALRDAAAAAAAAAPPPAAVAGDAPMPAAAPREDLSVALVLQEEVMGNGDVVVRGQLDFTKPQKMDDIVDLFRKQYKVNVGDLVRIHFMEVNGQFQAPRSEKQVRAFFKEVQDLMPRQQQERLLEAPIASGVKVEDVSESALKAVGDNAIIEKAIQRLNPKAILKPGHDALMRVSDDKITEKDDRHYAFSLEKNDKGEPVWFFYKAATEGNAVLEVQLRKGKFSVEVTDKDGNEKWVSYVSLENLLKHVANITDVQHVLE